MKKYVYAFLMCFGITILLSACKSMSDQEMVITETVTGTEIEEPTSEEFTEDGEKITTFKISGKACNKWWGDTTAELTEFFNTGAYWVLEDDFISATDKVSYVELKMSESNIEDCSKKCLNALELIHQMD